jgi:aromatic-L-amino-acid/L-tryptophan decarboxylase
MEPERLALLAELEHEARRLDPGPAERERLREAVVAASERFLASLGIRRAYNRVENPGAGLLALPIQEEGRPIEELLEVWDREVVHPGSLPSSPGHLAYVPGGGLYTVASSCSPSRAGRRWSASSLRTR